MCCSAPDSLFSPSATDDYAALDRLMPHPVYAAQHWVCVLNPSDATFETLRPLLAEAYQIAVRRYRVPEQGRHST